MSQSENQLLIQLEWTSWKRHDLTVMRNVQRAQWESHREIIFPTEKSELASRWTESTWISLVHQWFRWKVINMLLWSLIVALAIDGCMVWKRKMRFWWLLRNSTATLPSYGICIKSTWQRGIIAAKIVPRRSASSSNPREFKTISAPRRSNGRTSVNLAVGICRYVKKWVLYL